MVTMSATERPQGQQPDDQPDSGFQGPGLADSGRPRLDLPDKAAKPSRVSRGLAGRHHQTWANRYASGMGSETGAAAKSPMGHGAGWEILSYLLAGMATYGGLGWVIGHFTHIQALFPIGMLAGIAISLSWIVYKYGRQK